VQKMNINQENITQNNKVFWNELCGTNSWKGLGLNEITPQNLQKFDSWYLNKMYPYLKKYIPHNYLKNKTVLEIGIGFATVSEKLFLNAQNYIGIDIAKSPIDILNYRITNHKKNNTAKGLQANALELPFENNSFDYLISIGAFHHTGNIQKCIDEAYRLLNDNGTAIIMLYNKNSFRRMVMNPLIYLFFRLSGKTKIKNYSEFERFMYDKDSNNNAAPTTQFTSIKEVKQYFSQFRKVKISVENFDNIYFPKTDFGIPRRLLINTLGRIWGLDLYIVAQK